MNKSDFLNTFSLIQRPGADKLLAWLESTDFFTAPASTRFHGNFEGGLYQHSMGVYRRLCELLDNLPDAPQISPEAALFARCCTICAR